MTNAIAKCGINECELECHGDGETCILHCPKSSYDVDFKKAGFLASFHQALVENIVAQQKEIETNRESLLGAPLAEYLAGKTVALPKGFDLLVKALDLHFYRIVFPGFKSRDYFDYTRVLKKLGGIHFDKCEFQAFSLRIEKTRVFYQNCIFHQNWTLSDQAMLANYESALYGQCEFRGDVSGRGEDRAELVLDGDIFYNCNFSGNLDLSRVKLNDSLFCNGFSKKTAIGKILLDECVFKGKLLLNKFSLDEFVCENTVFLKKFELKQSIFGKFEFINSNVEGIFDAFETRFGKFFVKKSIFTDFVGFEKAEFKYPKSSENMHPAVFRYATFLKFLNFRGAVFHSGLDIESINLTMAPNFLGAHIDYSGTNRETFRIVKSSFDRSGNQVDGNKFFAQEMLKYEEELAAKPFSQEYLILLLNRKISNFGQSYLMPFGWIILVGSIFAGIRFGYEQAWLYKIHPILNEPLSALSFSLNSFALSLLPFHRLLVTGMEFLSLVFGVFISSLVWQVIVAVKRHTKR